MLCGLAGLAFVGQLFVIGGDLLRGLGLGGVVLPGGLDLFAGEQVRLGHVVMRVGGVGVGAVLPGLGGLCAGGLGGLAGALGVLPQIADNGGVFAALDGEARLFPLCKGVNSSA